MPNPTPGTEIGAYRIEGVIGAGSMGDVLRAVDVGLNRRVAVKILSERHRDSNELRARFVREGRAVAAIQHPNVVQVFATGTYDDRPYIAMELLDGTDLASAVDADGPMTGAAAAHAVLDAARGLQAAARAGLIHRDVKPSNLVLLTDGTVKVTDFGLAKPVDPGTEPALTALGVVVGTPDYIAPEQARGESIDERVDLYALGGTLYFLLTGVPPFRTGTPSEDKYLKVVARHLKHPAPDARDRNPAADGELAELARALMAKKPDERPDYDEVVARLEHASARLDGGGGPARPGRLPSVPGPAGGGTSSKTPFVGGDGPRLSDTMAAPIRRPRLPRWLWLVTAASVTVFAAGLIAYLTRDTRAAAPPGPGTEPVAVNDAGPIEIDAPPPPPRPVPPDGMVLVDHYDGTPWLFVDARPVTAAEYAVVFPKLKKPSRASADQPVVRAPYNFAQTYAKKVGKRLLTADEWDAAVVTPGVIASPARYEWVSPSSGKKAPVRAPGKSAFRSMGGHKDVTFRLALDLPATP